MSNYMLHLCFSSMKGEYDRLQTDEAQLRRECRDLEKSMALTKHDLKEVNRHFSYNETKQTFIMFSFIP